MQPHSQSSDIQLREQISHPLQLFFFPLVEQSEVDALLQVFEGEDGHRQLLQ